MTQTTSRKPAVGTLRANDSQIEVDDTAGHVAFRTHDEPETDSPEVLGCHDRDDDIERHIICR
jgi:hypothetical protein